MKLKRSITELSNDLTSNIDIASSEGMVRYFRQADAQIFSGFLDLPGLYDTPTLETLHRLAIRAAQTLASPKGVVVLAGAGTSGRLATLATRTFNTVFTSTAGRAPFKYLMAGGDSAIVKGQEGAEDNSTLSVLDLENAIADANDIFYVGITCGMSAPYIAGQLEALKGNSAAHSVLMGFNPLELARDVAIEGYHSTFKQIATATDAATNGTLLNPIVGPEPITGSTRMKSGSTTKILLEVLFHAARLVLEKNPDIPAAIVSMLRAYEDAVRETYMQIDSIAALVDAGGNALRSKAHIYYLGSAGEDPQGRFQLPADAGILGLIDASECPPTYGASLEDVRGFTSEGWLSIVGHMPEFASSGTHYQFSFDDFRTQKMDTLSANDLVVFLGEFEKREELRKDVSAKGAQTASIMWHDPKQPAPAGAPLAISLPIPHHDMLAWGPTQLGIKLVINALTTGAHIIAGKVYGNRMVDLGISNNKLFFRTVGIISDLIAVDEKQATDALLRSIFETDTLANEHRQAPISTCIERAMSVNKVVPKALLLATGRFTLAEATAALQRDPIVRTALEHYVQNQ